MRRSRREPPEPRKTTTQRTEAMLTDEHWQQAGSVARAYPSVRPLIKFFEENKNTPITIAEACRVLWPERSPACMFFALQQVMRGFNGKLAGNVPLRLFFLPDQTELSLSSLLQLYVVEFVPAAEPASAFKRTA